MIEDVFKRDLEHYACIMPKISVALLVSALLVFITFRLAVAARDNRRAWPLLGLLGIAAAQSLLASLRWDFGVQSLRPVQIILACLLPPLAWISFRAFTLGRERFFGAGDAAFLLPGLLALAAMLFNLPEVIDVIVPLTSVFFGAICLRLALKGESALVHAPLNGAVDVQRGLWLVTCALFASAIVDLLVFADFVWGDGTRAASYVGWGNMFWLAVIGVSALWTGDTLPEEDDADTPASDEPQSLEDDQRIAAEIERKLAEEGFAKDANLTLSRLARRCGLPSRRVSRAINRVHKQSVSQFVNSIRIREACRLLSQSDISVTQAIYESGFQTKSNFNREFLRVMGKTPREWRRGQVN